MFEFLLGMKLVLKGVDLIRESSLGEVELEEGDEYLLVKIFGDSEEREKVAGDVQAVVEEVGEIEEGPTVDYMVIPGVEEEVEVPILVEEDVRRSIRKRLKRKRKKIKDIEKVSEEYQLESALEIEVDSEIEIEG